MPIWRQRIPENEKRNFRLFIADGTFFYLSQALLEPGVVVPAFLSCLTSSPYLIGLGTVIRQAGWLFPQVIVAGVAESKPFKKRLMLAGTFFHGLGILGIVPFALLFSVANPSLSLLAFLLFYAISSVGEGIAAVPWADIVAKSIGVTRRGRLMGYLQTTGGFAAFSAGGVVAWALSGSHFRFPRDYCFLMLLYFVSIMCSALALSLIEEPRGEAHHKRLSLKQQMERVPSLVAQNPGLKRLLLTKVLAYSYMMSLPFYVTYARNVMHIPDGLIGGFVGVQMLGQIVGSLSLGYVSDTHGNRWVVRLALTSALVAPFTALILCMAHSLLPAPVLTPLLLLIYLSLGITVSGTWMGFQNYLFELVEPRIRPTCIGLSNTLAAPVSLAPLLGGFIVSSLGYNWLFGITMLPMLYALFLSLGLREPRSGCSGGHSPSSGPG